MYKILILISFFLASPLLSCVAQQKVQTPNIVFIYADDIGYGDLGCYGATAVKTPQVDRLANEGIQFTNAYACASTCTPSRFSLLTGMYPWRLPNTGVARGDAPIVIPPSKFTVAKLLRDAGYATSAIGKWHLGLGEGGFNNQNWNGYITPGPKEIGFDYSYIMAATGDRTPCVYIENQRIVNLDPSDPVEVSYTTPFPGEPLGRDHPELLKMLPSQGHDQAIINGISRIGYMKGGKSALWVDENIADSITAKAVAFIKKNHDRPFFLYFGTNDIHVPRVPHPRFAGNTAMGARGDAIVEFDWSVGQILATLDSLGLSENTIFILTSDNGPVVDDGYQDEAADRLGNHTPSGSLRGGKYSAFEAGTRVPFIVRWNKTVKPGTSEALISQVDFLGCMAKLTGQIIPDGGAIDSFDQLDTWLGLSNKGRTYVMQNSGRTNCLVDSNWKYIEPSGGSKYDASTNIELGNDTIPQLYNLKKDSGERNNVAVSNPEIVKKLSEKLDAIKAGSKTR